MATARKKVRDHQRGFMKSREARRKKNDAVSMSDAGSRLSVSSGPCPPVSSMLPSGSSLVHQSATSTTGSRTDTGGTLQDMKSIRSTLAPTMSSSKRVTSACARQILKAFDGKTGQMRGEYRHSLSGDPLPRCAISAVQRNRARDSAIASRAGTNATNEIGAKYGGLDHGFDWWHPEISRSEEKFRQSLRIARIKGGTLSVALKTSGSVVYARSVTVGRKFLHAWEI